MSSAPFQLAADVVMAAVGRSRNRGHGSRQGLAPCRHACFWLRFGRSRCRRRGRRNKSSASVRLVESARVCGEQPRRPTRRDCLDSRAIQQREETAERTSSDGPVHRPHPPRAWPLIETHADSAGRARGSSARAVCGPCASCPVRQAPLGTHRLTNCDRKRSRLLSGTASTPMRTSRSVRAPP